MDTNEEYYSKHGMGEGDPGDINPDDHHLTPPDKNVSETEKLNRNESGFGRDWSYRASEEYIAKDGSQIDEETKELRRAQSAGEITDQKQNDQEDKNRKDYRDQDQPDTNWNSENNFSSRRK
jgi:hypothetical protein